MDKDNYLQKRFAKDSSIVSRKIADEFILVPIRQKAADLENVYTLDEVGARIWELVDGEKQVADIRDTLIEEFEVRPDEAEADVVEFLEQLKEAGCIRAV